MRRAPVHTGAFSSWRGRPAAATPHYYRPGTAASQQPCPNARSPVPTLLHCIISCTRLRRLHPRGIRQNQGRSRATERSSRRGDQIRQTRRCPPVRLGPPPLLPLPPGCRLPLAALPRLPACAGRTVMLPGAAAAAASRPLPPGWRRCRACCGQSSGARRCGSGWLPAAARPPASAGQGRWARAAWVGWLAGRGWQRHAAVQDEPYSSGSSGSSGDGKGSSGSRPSNIPAAARGGGQQAHQNEVDQQADIAGGQAPEGCGRMQEWSGESRRAAPAQARERRMEGRQGRRPARRATAPPAHHPPPCTAPSCSQAADGISGTSVSYAAAVLMRMMPAAMAQAAAATGRELTQARPITRASLVSSSSCSCGGGGGVRGWGRTAAWLGGSEHLGSGASGGQAAAAGAGCKGPTLAAGITAQPGAQAGRQARRQAGRQAGRQGTHRDDGEGQLHRLQDVDVLVEGVQLGSGGRGSTQAGSGGDGLVEGRRGQGLPGRELLGTRLGRALRCPLHPRMRPHARGAHPCGVGARRQRDQQGGADCHAARDERAHAR